ncbi:pyridoxamine-phosphate oxidase [Cryptotrichosporon argae]
MTAHIYSSTHPPLSSPSTPAPTDPCRAPAEGSVKLVSHNQYSTPRLLRTSLPAAPLALFKAWFTAALDPPAGTPAVREPEAMALSTSTASGVPSTRVVLLKTVDDAGFVFFTNYTSRKSAELAANPHASLAFYWKETSRQVRVVGRAEKVSREESEEYFRTRPRGSQIGAWASRQSTSVGEDVVAQRVRELEKRFEGRDVPLPDHWGGWRIVPFEVEFWCGQPSRLHDRFRYLLKDGEWVIDRLAP